MFLIFTSAILIIMGIYEQRLAEAEKRVRVEYKYIPRSLYEEQLAKNSVITDKIDDIFLKESPWLDRSVGRLDDLNTASIKN
jgi:hypothetical protein